MKIPNGGVGEGTERAEGGCNPIGRRTISSSIGPSPEIPETKPPTKENTWKGPMAPAAYVAEKGLFWNQ